MSWRLVSTNTIDERDYSPSRKQKQESRIPPETQLNMAS
jgi:hypothetical protein